MEKHFYHTESAAIKFAGENAKSTVSSCFCGESKGYYNAETNEVHVVCTSCASDLPFIDQRDSATDQMFDFESETKRIEPNATISVHYSGLKKTILAVTFHAKDDAQKSVFLNEIEQACLSHNAKNFIIVSDDSLHVCGFIQHKGGNKVTTEFKLIEIKFNL